ncbi:SHOCT domain-containing protein [Haloarcula brevis]|uniref:SHOCT domain-containing protein n=1 Tax=Haloarcula brevis TaxID=3111453 RepID=UPI00300F61A3
MFPFTTALLQHGPMGPHGGAMGAGTGATPGVWWLLLALVVFVAIGGLWYLRRQRTTAQPDSLETLKRQYANGEIDEAELETRADRLLQYES